MSNIDTRATIVAFKSGETKPLTGQVLVKAFGGKTKIAAVCVSVPVIGDDEIIARAKDLLPALRTAIRGARREILESLHTAKQTSAEHSVFDLDACIAKMLESSRLEETEVREWFASYVRDAFAASFVVKAKWTDAPLTVEQQTKIDQSSKAALDSFIAASCKKGAYLAAQARAQWSRLIDLAECEDDAVTAKIRAFFTACDAEDAKQADSLGLPI